jgi:hypothetical protein
MQIVPRDTHQRANMSNRLWHLLITGGVLALASTAWPSDDWQYWNQLVVKHEFTDRLALDVASEQKWLDDASDFFLYNVTVLPTVGLTENVSLGAGYRCEKREEDEQWLTENRFLVPLTVGWAAKPWLVQLRNQPEYRDLEDDQDRWRIRERVTLKRPIRVGELTVTPFISGEIFYDFTADQLNQNRIAAGLSAPWGKHMSLTIFYMNKAERDGNWFTTNALGTEIAFKF